MAAIRLRSERDFRALLASLTQDAQAALFHWQLYKDLRGAVRRFFRELNEAPAFWSLTIGAHRDAALFRLARLYEPHGGLSLHSLLETIRANLHLFDEAAFRHRLKDNPFVHSLAKTARRPPTRRLTTDIRAVSATDPLVQRIVALRNKVLAHCDPRVVVGTATSPALTLTERQMATLLRRAARIINRYSILFEAGSHLMRILGQDDYLRVLKAVREERVAAERRFQEELRRATR